MLKKQTVWLLTMLSLMIVLSVYYMTSDRDDLAYINQGELDEATSTDATDTNMDDATDSIINDISEIGRDEYFAMLRMELQDHRNMKKDQYKEIVASSTATTEEKNEALDNIEKIDDLNMKENIVEEMILASSDYEDVLVRYDEDKVHVHVKTDELSKTEANHIMQLVRDEFGEIPVNVDFQIGES